MNKALLIAQIEVSKCIYILSHCISWEAGNPQIDPWPRCLKYFSVDYERMLLSRDILNFYTCLCIQMQASGAGRVAAVETEEDDDDVPDLVENFDENN